MEHKTKNRQTKNNTYFGPKRWAIGHHALQVPQRDAQGTQGCTHFVSCFFQQTKAGCNSFWEHNPWMPLCLGQSVDRTDKRHLFLQRNYLFLKALWNSASLEAEHPYSERLAKQLFPNHNNQQIGLVLRIFSQYQELSISNRSTKGLCLLRFGCWRLGEAGWDRIFQKLPLGLFKAFEDCPSLYARSDACTESSTEGSPSWAFPWMYSCAPALAAWMQPLCIQTLRMRGYFHKAPPAPFRLSYLFPQTTLKRRSWGR